jgi:hypothetical protein
MAFVRKDSRYLNTEVINDSDYGEYFHNWKSIPIVQTEDDVIHEVEEKDLGRFDNLSYEYYGNQRLWWTIPHANTVEDPFSDVDWSEASDAVTYPNYAVMGINAQLEYPESLAQVKDAKLPEFEIGSNFKIPSRDVVQKAMLEAQKRGID